MEDLCQLCFVKKLVFPSWESFEQRLDNPNVYYVFYEYFLRAAVGDDEWKFQAKMKGNSAIDSDGRFNRMTSSLTEAFALVVLKNNYFAWLLEALQQYPGMMSDYDFETVNDDESDATSLSLTEVLLHSCYIDLDVSHEEQCYILVENTRHEESASPDINVNFEAAKNAFNQNIMRIRHDVHNSVEYLKLSESRTLIDSAGVDNHESKQKKRKIMKELKPYTGLRQKNEKAFRGWSSRAYTDMSTYKRAIEDDVDLYRRFDTAYRDIYWRVAEDSIRSAEEDDHDLDHLIEL
jgi:hypothetical protein